MHKSEFEVVAKILAAANSTYENGELQLDEELKVGERGDLLADFIAFEIREACKGNPVSMLQAIAAEALDRAINQLIDVKAAIEELDL